MRSASVCAFTRNWVTDVVELAEVFWVPLLGENMYQRVAIKNTSPIIKIINSTFDVLKVLMNILIPPCILRLLKYTSGGFK